MTPPFASQTVAAAFDVACPQARTGLLRLRALIFEVSRDLPGVGPLTEALRWGQPAYLTTTTGSGASLRLGVPKTARFALFVHCRTTLVADYKLMFPDHDRFDGARALLFDDSEQIDPLRHGWLIARTLTYHLPGDAR